MVDRKTVAELTRYMVDLEGDESAFAELVAVCGGYVGPPITLLPSGSRTSSGSGSDITSPRIAGARALLLVAHVTGFSGTTPTLDIEVHAKVGAGYFELAQFSRFAAATGMKMAVPERAAVPATDAEVALTASPTVAGTAFALSRVDWLDTLRVFFAIAGDTPSFTFSVVAYPVF